MCSKLTVKIPDLRDLFILKTCLSIYHFYFVGIEHIITCWESSISGKLTYLYDVEKLINFFQIFDEYFTPRNTMD